MKKILSPMEKIRFPESEELPEGVKEIDVKDTFGYCTELYPDVEWKRSKMAADRICTGIFLA